MKFSLKSLLIFVTLIACFCGIVSTLIYFAAKSGEAWNATAAQRVDDDDPGTPMGVMTGPVDADPIYDPEALAETSRELQAEMDAVSVEPAKIPIFEVKVGIDEVHGKKIVETMAGKCIAVTDGDTIKILVDNKEIKIKLDSIDCPELKDQPFGKDAKQALSELVFGKTVVIHKTGEDRYRRVLGFVMVGDTDVCETMIEKGLAWYYVKYGNSVGLAVKEDQAREAKIGLWSGEDPVAPWEWRKRKKKTGMIFKPNQPNFHEPRIIYNPGDPEESESTLTVWDIVE